MEHLTPDELFDLLIELEQYPEDKDAQVTADWVMDELISRGELFDLNYGGN